MYQVIVALVSGAGGTILGCFVAWVLMTRTERNRTRREALTMALEALEDYRVAYAQWYVEYLSPQAHAASGSWAKAPTGKPDAVYLKLMGDVDRARGRLRVLNGTLYAHFPEKVIKPLHRDIMKVLIMTSGRRQADSGEVEDVVERVCNQIPDIIRKYCP